MSLTPLPPTPRKVRLYLIFFALLAMNGPLPAELKFRENTVVKPQCVNSSTYNKITFPKHQKFIKVKGGREYTQCRCFLGDIHEL